MEDLPPKVGKALADVMPHPNLLEEVLVHVDVGDEATADGKVPSLLLCAHESEPLRRTYAGGCEEASSAASPPIAAVAALALLVCGLSA